MLGFELSERTVSRWMRRPLRNPQPAKRWLTFLKNHREAIAAMDFFTVPTVTFRLIHCFFVILELLLLQLQAVICPQLGFSGRKSLMAVHEPHQET